jgi:cytochrome P450 family 135
MTEGFPPGPPLPRWVQAGLFGLSPLGFMRACHRRYGDRITLRLPRFGTYVYLADPEDIRTVFRGDAETYHAGEANGLLLAAILGPSSVLVTDEDTHLRQRRLVAPPFHGSAVRRQVDHMAEIAAADIERWPMGRPMQLLPRMRAITLEVILRTVIGATGEDHLATLRQVLPPVVDLHGINQLQFLIPQLRSLWPWRRFRAVEERANAAVYGEIAACRADPNLKERTDVLAMLVRARDQDGSVLTDAELRDQLVTLLLAGHETTATGLAWTFERLVRHPDVLARAQDAALEEDDSYLDMVVNEAMRVRPVVIDIARRLTRAVEIGGYLLPAGTLIAPAIMLVQTSEHNYEEPLRFDPSRWTDRHVDPGTWLPFGGGNRRCLGAAFATTEMRTVLRTVLQRVDLDATTAKGERPKIRHVTVVPRAGSVVTARRRNTATGTA